jgi:hypothetical protein
MTHSAAWGIVAAATPTVTRLSRSGHARVTARCQARAHAHPVPAPPAPAGGRRGRRPGPPRPRPTALLRAENAAIAHAAPWLQNSSVEADDRTFTVFADRQEQIAPALKSLTISGVRGVGAVFASAREAAAYT